MKKSFFYLHIAIFLAGITGVFGKLIHLNEVLITFYRMLFAAIILVIVTSCAAQVKVKYSKTELLKMGGIGFLLGLHWIFFYGSIKYSNISVGVVCFCLTVFFTSVLEPVINKKKIAVVEVLLSFLTLMGIALIFSFDTQFRIGIILGVISSLFVAIYTILNERIIHQYDTKELTKIEMIGGTIGLAIMLPLIVQFYPIDSYIPSSGDLFYLLILSAICTVLLYYLLNFSMKKISAFTVNLSFNLEPIYAILIAVFFFDEYKDLNFNFFVGLILILLSLILQMLRVVRQK